MENETLRLSCSGKSEVSTTSCDDNGFFTFSTVPVLQPLLPRIPPADTAKSTEPQPPAAKSPERSEPVAHLGDAGDTLSVLSAAAKSLAEETGAESAEMARLLGTMQELVGGFERQVAARSQGTELGQELEAAIAELHEVLRFTSTRLEHIAGLAGRLSGELSQAEAAFQVDTRFREAIDSALTVLDRLHGDAPVAASAALAAAAGRYTMHAERLVHSRFGGGDPAAAPPPAPAPAAPAASEDELLGENVELF